MRRVIGLLWLAGCASPEAYLAPPAPLSAESWLVSRSEGGPWTLAWMQPALGPLRASLEGEVWVLDYAEPTGLPLDRRPSREDLGTADCGVLAPLRSWALSSEPELGWEERAPSPGLHEVLTGLARESCHHCVEFEASRIILGEPDGEDSVAGLLALPSGAAIVLQVGRGLRRVEREGAGEFLRDCPPGLFAIDGPSSSGRYHAASPSHIFELELIAEEGRCRMERSFALPTPLSQLYELRASRPGEPFELFLLGFVASDTWQVLRFDGASLTLLTELSRGRNEHRSLVRLGPEDLLVSNQTTAVRWTRGTSTDVTPPGVNRVVGASAIPGFGVFILATRELEAGAFELELSRNQLRTPVIYGQLPDRMQTTTSFRGGMIGVHRGGRIVEFPSPTESCVSALELGDWNHTPRSAVSLPGDHWLTDTVGEERGTTLSWLRPLPPPGPSPDLFP